jgi:hypothetical protein
MTPGMNEPSDAGFVLPLLLAIIAGVILAGLASLALVNAGSPGGQAPIQAPIITYDST